MLTRARAVAMITLALLNVFVVAAALAVVKLTPNRSLAPQPPTVARRAIAAPDGPVLPGASSSAALPSASALAARLAGPMAASGLGKNLNGVVVDANTRKVLFNSHAEQPAVPASTTKLTTSVAVLAAVGPDQRLTTKVVRSGRKIVLVGAGDPTLAVSAPKNAYPKPASLTDLAKQTAAALKGAGKVKVDYDTSLYQGSRAGPGWKPNYLPDGETAPITALTLDEGRVAPGSPQRVADPPRSAALAFAHALGRYGVTATVGVKTTAPKTAPIASVSSPPIAELVEELLTHSDNDLAEAMIRQVAIKRHQPVTFQGGAQAVHEVLAGLGVGPGVGTVDGSGLSPLNRITPAALARILAVASSGKHPELRSVVTGMPIAGFTGTLAGRYGVGPAAQGRGLVRAKTGTLDGVNTLAGLAYDADGRLLAFAFMANKVKSPAAALASLDSLAATLATCGCH